MTRTSSLLATGLLVLTAIAMPRADAAIAFRTWNSHGPGHCQGALPSYEGALRKRPKAIANQGAAPAFVTCDFDSIDNTGLGSTNVRVAFINRSAGARDVSCTLVDGIHDGTFSPSLTKTATVPATQSRTLIWDKDSDNAGSLYLMPALSCVLPPGVEIGLVQLRFAVEIGS